MYHYCIGLSLSTLSNQVLVSNDRFWDYGGFNGKLGLDSGEGVRKTAIKAKENSFRVHACIRDIRSDLTVRTVVRPEDPHQRNLTILLNY